MRGRDLLTGIDLLHRERDIPRDVIFGGIEKALRLAIYKKYDATPDDEVSVIIDRASGEIVAQKSGQPIDPVELGRIAAQAAKQHLIQNFREEESNRLISIYSEQKGDLIIGQIQRFEGGAALVTLGKTEALLPRSEQIPGESHHIGERVKAIILEVKRNGHRVRIILSRTHPDFVRRLFENEIPEIQDHTIEIRAVAREAGYRSKVAVSSIDMKVDCVGACVGVRGSRIKNIIDELGGERIDIVRWNDSLQVLIPNALSPAEVEEVFLYPRLGRAIVLVKEDQLSLAIGRRGQNVRLASRLVGWDIEIMTHDELSDEIDKALGWFTQIPNVTPEMAEAYIEEGFLSFDDLTFVEAAELAELGGVDEDVAEEIIAWAEEAAETVVVEEKPRRPSSDESRSHAPAPLKQSPAERAAELFADAPDAAPEPVTHEIKPTVESVFGPDALEKKPEEPALSAAQVFGEAPPAGPEESTPPETPAE